MPDLDKLRAQKQTSDFIAKRESGEFGEALDLAMMLGGYWALKRQDYNELASICEMKSGGARQARFNMERSGVIPLTGLTFADSTCQTCIQWLYWVDYEQDRPSLQVVFVDAAGCLKRSIDDPNYSVPAIRQIMEFAAHQDQQEEDRIKENLSAPHELTPDPMTCLECRYHGKMQLLGKTGLIFRKMKMKCPRCNRVLNEV